MAFGDNLPQAIKDITEQNKVVRKTGNYSQSQRQRFLIRGRSQPRVKPLLLRSPYYRQQQRG